MPALADEVLQRSADDERSSPRVTLLANAREGLEAKFLAERLASAAAPTVLFVARDQPRLDRLTRLVRFFAANVEILGFPAWDCLPYDRISPSSGSVAERLATLARLAHQPSPRTPRLVVTTSNALVQKLPPPGAVLAGHRWARAGEPLDRGELLGYLERNGYRRSTTVVEPGEYAVRGGLLDLWPSGRTSPLRLDFFGPTLESVRSFDPLTQRTLDRLDEFELTSVSELAFDGPAIERFTNGYLRRFGAVTQDPLLDSIQAGRPYPGMEHWLPLFHEELVPLTGYLPERCEIAFDHLALDGIAARLQLIGEHYEARRDPKTVSGSFGAAPYRPLPPDMLYLDEQAMVRLRASHREWCFSIFGPPPTPPQGVQAVVDLGGRPARDFARERADRSINLFDAIVGHLDQLAGSGARPIIAAWTKGSGERLKQVLEDHGLEGIRPVRHWRERNRVNRVGLAVLPIEHGLEADGICLLAEQDLLGDRLTRGAKRTKRADKFIADLSAIGEGDLVVHAEHGIGRFEGLVTLEIGGAPHDCLKLIYAGGDKLFVPVENLEILSRYGQSEEASALDKLGGAGWQSRKAKVKERIRELADELIKIAAQRALKHGTTLELPPGMYEEFAARFPYEETEDQLGAIEAVLGDMASGVPMDRLICGDVGFGKTEVAIRAAFVAAMSGRQVAVLAPTTLLARQHFRVFSERFAGLPIRIGQLSRFVGAKDAAETRRTLASGELDIVIGTHALLSKSVTFRDLGLVVVDEEQHFGVSHKEKLKQLRAEVHMLTMTATPIPRTLHMALGGMKDLSIIATPPVDRLAVRSFVMPADPVVIREAILREYHRGGQSFYVCPRISDQPRLHKELVELVPEIKIGVANGRMAASELETLMGAFYDGNIDLLLATNIVESGLDIPRANTLIVHRSDQFGLSQLYQLRGRIGRSKVRGYAYFTVPPDKKLAEAAEKRLSVVQSLDGLGAGFQLASHDLDIRGAGNLLGEEQSGQIREVGFELYNQMLEEAVAELRAASAGAADEVASGDWTPQITIDAAALMPESYIGDLDLRLAMYRRLAALESEEDLDAFRAELIDRFGVLPLETEQLVQIVGIKQLCRRASVHKIEVGPKGAVITFFGNRFSRPERLVGWIAGSRGEIKVRPDHKLVWIGDTRTPPERLQRARKLLAEIVALAA